MTSQKKRTEEKEGRPEKERRGRQREGRGSTRRTRGKGRRRNKEAREAFINHLSIKKLNLHEAAPDSHWQNTVALAMFFGRPPIQDMPNAITEVKNMSSTPEIPKNQQEVDTLPTSNELMTCCSHLSVTSIPADSHIYCRSTKVPYLRATVVGIPCLFGISRKCGRIFS